jgi:quinol monooxygenase YgiN
MAADEARAHNASPSHRQETFMHHVLARITFKPEAAAEGKDLLLNLMSKSRAEAGCVSYDVYQQAEAPHIFQTVEQWKEKADADAHMATPHFALPPEILAWGKLA